MEHDQVRAASIRLSTVATTTRQTPKTDFGSVMRAGLIRAGNVVAEGLQVAAPFVPGGTIVSAALAGANRAADMTATPQGGNFGQTAHGLTADGTPGTPRAGGTLVIPSRGPGLRTDLSKPAPRAFVGSDAGSSNSFNQMIAATRQMTEFQASFNLQYLELQEKIQTDTRQFNLISNIMKTKHDAAKNALNNVR